MSSIAKFAFAKRFNTVVRRKTAGAVKQAARYLLRLETTGYSYSACLRLLADVSKDSMAELLHLGAGDAPRRLRAYAQEAYHLIRAELQHLRGRAPKVAPGYRHGTTKTRVQAHIDGSVRNNKASACFWLQAGTRELAAGTFQIDAKTSSDAETTALILAMKTALAFGHDCLRILTDAECLVDLLHEKSRLKDRALGQEALRLVRQFKSFELEVVPRLFNHRADAHALAATRA